MNNAEYITGDAVCRGGWSRAAQYSSQYGANANDIPNPIDHEIQANPANQKVAETRTCYNCGEKGHIRPNCTKPRKAKGQGKGQFNGDMANLAQLIAEAVITGLNAKN